MTEILNARPRPLQGRITADMMPQEMREALRPEFDTDDLHIRLRLTYLEDGQVTFNLYILRDTTHGHDAEYASEERFKPAELFRAMPVIRMSDFLDDKGPWVDESSLVDSILLEWVTLNIGETMSFDRAGDHDDIVIGFAVAGRVVEVRIPPHDHHHWFNPLGAFDPDQED